MSTRDRIYDLGVGGHLSSASLVGLVLHGGS
jgi:hypothetical protein